MREREVGSGVVLEQEPALVPARGSGSGLDWGLDWDLDWDLESGMGLAKEPGADSAMEAGAGADSVLVPEWESGWGSESDWEQGSDRDRGQGQAPVWAPGQGRSRLASLLIQQPPPRA